jgi:hypothetical protein
VEIVAPTPHPGALPVLTRERREVSIPIDDVELFSQSARTAEDTPVVLTQSEADGAIDGFYWLGMPFPSRPVLESPKSPVMTHPLQRRTALPKPAIRVPSMPKEW